jgi:hypothetical protein
MNLKNHSIPRFLMNLMNRKIQSSRLFPKFRKSLMFLMFQKNRIFLRIH